MGPVWDFLDQGNIYLSMMNVFQHLQEGVPNGSEKRVSIHHPLGFNWHPFEGPGFKLFFCCLLVCFVDVVVVASFLLTVSCFGASAVTGRGSRSQIFGKTCPQGGGSKSDSQNSVGSSLFRDGGITVIYHLWICLNGVNKLP